MDANNEIFDNANYQSWREIHTRTFGEIFASAFSDHPEAQVHLTAALIHISNRRFEEAMPKLDLLESICASEFDEAAVHYFKGLNHEFMGNEESMTAYYEKLLASEIPLRVPFSFHPYYRTAKFAQRDSECRRAVYYYRKALAFYDGIIPDAQISANVGQIIYDIATVYLYMHRYDECERFLNFSKTYLPQSHQQRDFVEAILYAAQGKVEASQQLLSALQPFFRSNCEPTVKAILSGTDPHYCIVPQNRRKYERFWTDFSQRLTEQEELQERGDAASAEAIVSELLTDAFPFMKRKLSCRIEMSEERFAVYCKDYYVKTLTVEYDMLFAGKPAELSAWTFVAVHDFENWDF